MIVSVYDALGTLPHFNPDLDVEGMAPPSAVGELRARIREAGGVLFSTPEYAHGLPGSLKNALDWLVSDPGFYGKAIGIVNTSPHSRHAHAALLETLATMGTRLVPSAVVELPIRGRHLDADEIAADAELSAVLRAGLAALVDAASGQS